MVVKDLVEDTVVKMKWVPTTQKMLADISTTDLRMNVTFLTFNETG